MIQIPTSICGRTDIYVNENCEFDNKYTGNMIHWKTGYRNSDNILLDVHIRPTAYGNGYEKYLTALTGKMALENSTESVPNHLFSWIQG